MGVEGLESVALAIGAGVRDDHVAGETGEFALGDRGLLLEGFCEIGLEVRAGADEVAEDGVAAGEEVVGLVVAHGALRAVGDSCWVSRCRAGLR